MEDTFPRHFSPGTLPQKSILPQLRIKPFLKFSQSSNEMLVEIDRLTKIFHGSTVLYSWKLVRGPPCYQK